MNYDLVFEGGGAKGMVFVGAMQEFEQRQHGFNRLLGTSAGAITATFLAAGYNTQEMNVALNERINGRPIFTTFMSQPAEVDDEAIQNSATLALLRRIDLPLISNLVEGRVDVWLTKALMRHARNLFSFIEQGGWYSADNFLTWFQRKLDESKFQDGSHRFSEMTLAEFYAVTGRDLSLVASDTSGERMLVLNHKTAPDLPLVCAVRMSMSIPLVWPEVEWQTSWGTYMGHDITGHFVVDGGLLSNFPIELLISTDEHILQVMGPKEADSRVLGLLIDEEIAVENAPASNGSKDGFSPGQLQLMQRLNRLINTATGAHDKMVVEAFEELVVRLPAQGYGTTEFDMSDARRDALIQAGQQAMREYLDWRDEMPFALETEDEFYEINIANHADRVASSILDW